jgi:hypothetical protein
MAASAVARLPELVSSIVDCLEDDGHDLDWVSDSPRAATLRSLAVTSFCFHAVATQLLYHRFYCTSVRRLRLFVAALQSRPLLGVYVQQIDCSRLTPAPETNELILSVLSLTPNLRTVHLARLNLSSPNTIELVERLKKCPDLESLIYIESNRRASPIPFSAVRQNLALWPRLKRLVVSNSLSSTSDSGASLPVQTGPAIACRLEEVNMTLSDLLPAELDTALTSSGHSLRKLSLTLLSSPAVAMALMRVFGSFKSLEHLECVEGVGRTHGPYEGLFDSIVTSWPSLKRLSLTGNLFTGAVRS